MILRTVALVLFSAVVACGGAAIGTVGDGGSGSGSGGGSGGSGSSSGGGGGSSGGSGSSSSGGGSSSGGLVAACPAQAPQKGAACTNSSLDCEYGSDPALDCDTLAVCNGTSFTVTSPTGGGECPTPGAGQDGCPAARSDITAGQACSPNGADCAYPQGRCTCTISLGGPVMINPDGGALSPFWYCEQPGSGCPEPRPRLGSACATAGQSCDYGSCSLPGGSAMVCSNGAWTQTAIPCPL